MSNAVRRKDPLLAGIAATAVTVGFVVAALWFWTRFALVEAPLSVPVVAYFFGAILLVQLVRCVFMHDWFRRAAALGTVVGVFLLFVGMGPMANCADTFPLRCGTSFHPVFLILVVGFLLTTALVYVNIWRR